MISRFQIRSLKDVSREPEAFAAEYVLTIRVRNSAVFDEEIVEHFLMTTGELGELFDAAESAIGVGEVKRTIERLTRDLRLRETQVADLRRELERERARVAAIRSLVRTDDDSADEEGEDYEEEEEDGVEQSGDWSEDDPLTFDDYGRFHAMLDATGANFPPKSSLKVKVRAVCDEFLGLRSTWSGMDPVAVSKSIQDCDDLRRFRDAVGQMAGADNPRSIPSVLAALSRMVTAPQREAKARIDGEQPKKIPASYAWTFREDGVSTGDKVIIQAPTLKEARLKGNSLRGSWAHVPETKEERDRAYMESCDYPPRMVDPA